MLQSCHNLFHLPFSASAFNYKTLYEQSSLRRIGAIALAVIALVLFIKIKSKASQPISNIKPAEFSPLIQKINKVVRFKQFNPTMQTSISSRDILIGTSGEWFSKPKTTLFFKTPGGKHAFIRSQRAVAEEIAFLISHRLELNVVPPTMCLSYTYAIETSPGNYDWENSKVENHPLCQFLSHRHFHRHHNSGMGTVVQQAIDLDPCQPSSENFSVEKAGLNIFQVQKAILFNLITARIDSAAKNTLINSRQELIEHDNERIGWKKSDSWLLTAFADTLITKEIKQMILNKTIDSITSVFEDMNHFTSAQLYQEQIIKNFEKIKDFFQTHLNDNVTVRNLTTL